MSLFEQATRKKLRFTTQRGEITTEQLWDLPLIARNNFDLDTLARGVKRELDAVSEESFIPKSTNPAKTELNLKLDMLKHIIDVKLKEREAAAKRAERAEERHKLLTALAHKNDEERQGMSKEEILKRLDDLE